MSEDERMFWRMERYAKPWPPDWLPRMQVADPTASTFELGWPDSAFSSPERV